PDRLGAWLVAEAIWHQHGEPCVSVKACHSMRGGLNGGTLASLLNAVETGQDRMVAEPFLLNPAGTAPHEMTEHADPIAPHRDADFNAWVGPFMMGPINTRVVRRSAALLQARGDEAYGVDFNYQEYLRFGRGPLAAAAAVGFSVGMGAGQAAIHFKPVRALARAVAVAPGEGPSERTMDGGSFRCELVGRSASGKVMRSRIAGDGDPGNRATTKFVCEAALALALQLPELPGGADGGGVLTPASGLGSVLAERLIAAGMTLEPVRDRDRKARTVRRK
ncbi:MAG: hypothetical protein ACREBN_00670, partial [Burkholderiaceae bacterium]